MPVDHIRYDILVQQALRGMVRDVLAEAGKNKGMPGEHHFFITFDTTAEDVRLSDRLRAQYPEEMTIVLQHQFWNLQVGERHFEVELSFNEIAEKLVVPFSAVKGFFDPAAQFALQFEMVEEQVEAAAEPAPSLKDQPAHGQAPEAAPEALPAPTAGPRPSNDDQKIVSLDSFRKK